MINYVWLFVNFGLSHLDRLTAKVYHFSYCEACMQGNRPRNAIPWSGPLITFFYRPFRGCNLLLLCTLGLFVGTFGMLLPGTVVAESGDVETPAKKTSEAEGVLRASRPRPVTKRITTLGSPALCSSLRKPSERFLFGTNVRVNRRLSSGLLTPLLL